MTKNNKMLQVLLVVMLMFSLVATPVQALAHAMTADEGLVELETGIVDLEDEVEMTEVVETDELDIESEDLGDSTEVIVEDDELDDEDSEFGEGFEEGDSDWSDVESEYFVVTDVTSTTITVEWKIQQDSTAEYRLVLGNQQIYVDENMSSYTFTDLLPGNYYEIDIELNYNNSEDGAIDDWYYYDYVSVEIEDDEDFEWIESNFEYFEVTDTTSTSVTVEWEVSNDIMEKFEIGIGSSYEEYSEERITLDGNTRSYTFTDLVPGQSYEIYLSGHYYDDYNHYEDNYDYYTSIGYHIYATAGWSDDELTPVNFIIVLNEDMTYDERIKIRGLSESNQNFERDFWLYESNSEIKLPLGEYEVVLYNEEDYSISAHHNFTINAGVDYKNNPLQFQFKLKEMNEAAEPFKYEIINVKENSFTLRWNDVSKINSFRVIASSDDGEYGDSHYVEFNNELNEYTLKGLGSNYKYFIDLYANYLYDITDNYYFNVKTYGEDAKAEKVNFLDEALRDAAAKKIGIYDRDVTVVDMKDLTNLNLYWKEITDLEGIQYAKELESLYLDDNEINDISSLSELINLNYLSIDGNNISDISALEKLDNLLDLRLGSNQIKDISVLSNLVNMRDLDLSYNEIIDLSGLGALTKLNYLSLRGNQIVDVSELGNLIDLEYLYLDNNNIGDITNLANLLSLTRLDLDNNQISDIVSLAKLSNLETLYLNSNEITKLPSLSELTSLNSLYLSYNEINNISDLAGLSNLETLYLNSNKITELASLSELTSLNSLYLSYNEINNISDLAGLTNLENLTLYNNEITDISALSELKNLRYLDLENNQITDISVLRELPHLETVYLYGNDITDEETIQYLRNEGVYVGYYSDDWNDWEDDDDEEEIIIDREEVEKVFPAESGFNVSDDGKTITFDISDTNAGDKIDLTPEQTKVLIENKQDLNINRGEVKASIPASSFDNYDEPVTINVNEIESDPNSLSATYDFTIKQGTRNISQFDEGIALTFNVNASRANNPNNLKVFYKNEQTGKWENIGGSYSNGAVTVVTYHFSTFTVFEAEEEHEDKIVEVKPLEEVVEEAFTKETGFVVSEEGRAISVDIADADQMIFTKDQMQVLVDNKNDLTIKVVKAGVELSIPVTSFANYKYFDRNEELTISVEEIAQSKLLELENSVSLSDIYDFTISQESAIIREFGNPITLKFAVDKTLVKNEDNVNVFYYNGQIDEWTNIGGSYSDGFITVETDHFSIFTVFEIEEDGAEVPETPADPEAPADSQASEDVKDPETPANTDDDSGKGYEVIDGQDTEGDNLVDGSDETSATEDDQDSDSDQKETSDGDKALPSTATPIYNYLMIGFMLMLIGFAVLFVSKRRKA